MIRLAIILSCLLLLGHMTVSMLEQWHYEQDMIEVRNFIELSTRLHRQVCRNTVTKPEDLLECNR